MVECKDNLEDYIHLIQELQKQFKSNLQINIEDQIYNKYSWFEKKYETQLFFKVISIQGTKNHFLPCRGQLSQKGSQNIFYSYMMDN